MNGRALVAVSLAPATLLLVAGLRTLAASATVALAQPLSPTSPSPVAPAGRPIASTAALAAGQSRGEGQTLALGSEPGRLVLEPLQGKAAGD